MQLIRSHAVLATLTLVAFAAGVDAEQVIFTQQAKLVAGDGQDRDHFGQQVAISGDTALVAGGGAVYVFVRSSTTWTQQAKLWPEDGGWFAPTLAISGDMALVGDTTDTDAGDHAGAVYVFVRSGTTWTQQEKLFADGATQPFFGHSMALSGETLVVGAFTDDMGGYYHGEAFVFIHNGMGWIQQAKLATEERCYHFAYSVAIAGDTVLVGAPSAWPFGPAGCLWQPLPPDAAFVFVRNGTEWSEQAKLIGGADQVAVSGDTGLVSPPARVYVRTGTTWTQQATLGGDGSLVVSGDLALVGAIYDDEAGTAAGAVDIFARSGTTWTKRAKLIGDDTGPWDRFGTSLAFSGDTLLVGAPGDWNPASLGSAYVFVPPDSDGDGVPDELDVCPDTTIPESVPTRNLGRNRFALVDEDGVFDTNRPPGRGPEIGFTIEETAGCSCEQIIDALGLGRGHEKFGCSLGAMEAWVELVNP